MPYIASKSKAVHLGAESNFWKVPTVTNDLHKVLQRFNALPDDVVLPSVQDLRPTVATRMAEPGVQPRIVEAVLNHVSGHNGGAAGIYNRPTYDKEKREALNLWAEHVVALVGGRKAVVVPLRRA
jgi:hypothetical protein